MARGSSILPWAIPTSSVQKPLRREFSKLCPSSASLCPAFHVGCLQALCLYLQFSLLQTPCHTWDKWLPGLRGDTSLHIVYCLCGEHPFLCSCLNSFRSQLRSHFLQEDFQAPKSQLDICPGTYSSLQFFPDKTHLFQNSL